MNDKNDINLETKLHSLLCGDLNDAQRVEILEVLVGNTTARQLLAEMLNCQQLAREAFGYDVDQSDMPQLIGRLQTMLSNDTQTNSTNREPQRSSRPRRHYRLSWLLRIAAMIVIGTSLFVGVASYLNSRLLQEKLSGLDGKIVLAGITPSELASYQKIWQEIVVPGEKIKPLIVLHNGSGKLEYPAVTSSEVDGGRMIVLRCSVVSSDGRLIERINLLVPSNLGSDYAVSDVGHIAGQPVRVNVSASESWADIGLEVGDHSDGLVGLRGRTQINGQVVEVLASGNYTQGYHNFTFNAERCSSGIYFLHAYVPGKMTEIRKVVLMN